MRGTPDLGDLPRELRQPQPARLVLAWSLQLLTAVSLGWSAVGRGDRVLAVLFSASALSALVGLLLLWIRPARTVIDEDGLLLPTAWGVPRRVAWSQVRGVRPAWYPKGQSTVVLTDGRTHVLRYVPPDAARRLAAAVRSSSTKIPAPVEDPHRPSTRPS